MAQRMRDSYGPWVIDWVAEGLARAVPGFDRTPSPRPAGPASMTSSSWTEPARSPM